VIGAKDIEENEVGLFDLLETLRDAWRWLLSGTILGVICASTVLAITSPQYEAVALLQTGKVAGNVIEEVPTIVERLKSSSFLLEIAQEVGDQNWIDQINAGVGKNILLAIMPKATPSMVEVRVRAKSSAAAIDIADKATTNLIRRQDVLSSQILKKVHFDLDVAKEKLARTENDLQMLNKALASTKIKDDRFSQLSLLTSMKLQKDSELYGLRQTVFSLEGSLLPPATQPARVLEKIFVPTIPVSPSKSLILGLGLLGGLILGAVVGLVSGAWRRRIAERHSAVA